MGCSRLRKGIGRARWISNGWFFLVLQVSEMMGMKLDDRDEVGFRIFHIAILCPPRAENRISHSNSRPRTHVWSLVQGGTRLLKHAFQGAFQRAFQRA